MEKRRKIIQVRGKGSGSAVGAASYSAHVCYVRSIGSCTVCLRDQYGDRVCSGRNRNLLFLLQ